jgi:hypothetical protein
VGATVRARELERFEDLARNQMSLISLIDSLQTLLFKILFDTSADAQALEFRKSSPSEAATVLSFRPENHMRYWTPPYSSCRVT